ncbi:MAG: hypothetical protein R2941_03765 [Desulfobacterales bacterium]
MVAYHSEMVTLKEFYKGQHKEIKQNLETFLKEGKPKAKDSECVAVHPLDKEQKYPRLSRVIKNETVSRKEPATLEEVKTEIREDLAALNDYLKNSIF